MLTFIQFIAEQPQEPETICGYVNNQKKFEVFRWKKGWRLYRVNTKSVEDFKTKQGAIRTAEMLFHGHSIEIEWKRQDTLTEDAPISMDTKNFGFITTEGRVVRGEPGIDLHPIIARRLGFKGQLAEKKAIKAGYVRFAVSENGDATFEFVPGKAINRHVVKFIEKTPHIIGTVYVDIDNSAGGRERSEQWPVDKAIRMIPGLAIGKD